MPDGNLGRRWLAGLSPLRLAPCRRYDLHPFSTVPNFVRSLPTRPTPGPSTGRKVAWVHRPITVLRCLVVYAACLHTERSALRMLNVHGDSLPLVVLVFPCLLDVPVQHLFRPNRLFVIV